MIAPSCSSVRFCTEFTHREYGGGGLPKYLLHRLAEVVDEFRGENIDWAIYQIDNRYDYGETRIRALGLIKGRVHALVFTETARGIRVISLRKANQREVKRYEQEIADS